MMLEVNSREIAVERTTDRTVRFSICAKRMGKPSLVHLGPREALGRPITREPAPVAACAGRVRHPPSPEGLIAIPECRTGRLEKAAGAAGRELDVHHYHFPGNV